MEKDTLKSGNAGNAPSVLADYNIFVIWKPEYDMGVNIIDEQHRGIVSIINSLYFGTQCNHIKNVLAPTIGMLKSYAQIHFQTEEYFLEAAKYIGVQSHRALHQAYISKLADIERKSLYDKDPYKLMMFLKEWWLGHICIEDMQHKDVFS